MRIHNPNLAPADVAPGGNTGGQTGDDAAAKSAADAAAKTAADAAAKATADADAKKTADAAAAATAESGQAAKDAEAKAAADAATKAGEKTAPDKYELKLPEKTTLDETDVKAIETIARENGWTNEQAQAALQNHHDTVLEQSAHFLEVTKADKTYGGEHLAKSQARAKAVIDKVRPANHPRRAAFTRLLDKSGYSNHIEIVAFLADLGAMTEEDGAVTGGGAARTGEKDPASVLYGGEQK